LLYWSLSWSSSLSSQSTKKTVGAARAALFVVLEALCLISDFFSEGCPLSRISLSVSLPLPRGKKKRFKKNDNMLCARFVFCTQTLSTNYFARSMMVTRCVVPFDALCSFRIISSSSSHHYVCCVGCVGRVFFYLKIYPMIGFVLCCSLSGAPYMFTFSVFATFSPSNVT